MVLFEWTMSLYVGIDFINQQVSSVYAHSTQPEKNSIDT